MTDEQEGLIPEDEAVLRLTQAQQELEAMTPDDYLKMVDHIRDLEDQVDLHEAGGVCWMDWYSPHGARINLTARATSPLLAAEKLISAARVLNSYGWTAATTGRYNPRPEPAPSETAQEPEYIEDQLDASPEGDDPGAEEVMEVTAMERDKTRAGVPYVRARGGFLTKYGVPAYDEVLRKVKFDISKYQHGDQISIPPNMRFMWVNTTKPMKVTAFSSKPDEKYK